ncbi:MAG: pilus assembly protein CpaB [Bradyrhizobium sp.]|nr:pilus assembly protein CpaB [Bradyrhizobium sp.]MEA2953130.1 pilus assembly protein CpaB [Alphaproteobacteria bacterium]
MRASTIVMTAFAVLFGLLAVFIAQSWLNNQAEMRMKSLEAQNKPTTTRTIVVAAKPLRFGTELTAPLLREIPWSQDAVPTGAFTSVSQLLTGGKRVVLSAIEQNEPVLALKVTGAGQRATLSSLVGDGMKAVTIRVNDVEGVGGFVLPGDRVDIVMTRQIDKTEASTEVVLQNARVLAIDQSADERSDKPTVAKAVTLEVATAAAQRLWLASSVGSLSLLLRKAGETTAENTRRVTLSDLNGTLDGKDTDTRKIVVTRGTTKQEYSVPIEGATSQEADNPRQARR